MAVDPFFIRLHNFIDSGVVYDTMVRCTVILCRKVLVETPIDIVDSLTRIYFGMSIVSRDVLEQSQDVDKGVLYRDKTQLTRCNGLYEHDVGKLLVHGLVLVVTFSLHHSLHKGLALELVFDAGKLVQYDRRPETPDQKDLRTNIRCGRR